MTREMVDKRLVIFRVDTKKIHKTHTMYYEAA